MNIDLDDLEDQLARKEPLLMNADGSLEQSYLDIPDGIWFSDHSITAFFDMHTQRSIGFNKNATMYARNPIVDTSIFESIDKHVHTKVLRPLLERMWAKAINQDVFKLPMIPLRLSTGGLFLVDIVTIKIDQHVLALMLIVKREMRFNPISGIHEYVNSSLYKPTHRSVANGVKAFKEWFKIS